MTPPVPPMLAKLSPYVPHGDFLYEPKWDGFRCLAFVSEGVVDLRSRHDRRLARYFPEVTAALAALDPKGFVMDGELVVARPGRLDFPALMSRLHPTASRVDRLSRELPATLVGFDLLARGAEDLRDAPFVARRAALEQLLAGASGPLLVTPITADLEVARAWLDRFELAGIDGVVAKERSLRYQPGRRAMVKVKHRHTVDCVLAGARLFPGEPAIASLLLGLYDGAVLRHVGVCSSFPDARRRELATAVRPLVTTIAGHPWENGFQIGHSPTGRLAGSAGRWDPTSMALDWVPLQPERVVEVAYDQLDALRFRHPARWVRWRPDRDPRSCTFGQLEQAVSRPDEVRSTE